MFMHIILIMDVENEMRKKPIEKPEDLNSNKNRPPAPPAPQPQHSKEKEFIRLNDINNHIYQYDQYKNIVEFLSKEYGHTIINPKLDMTLNQVISDYKNLEAFDKVNKRE